MTVNIGGRDHQIKLSGTIKDPYFCVRDVCDVLGYEDPLLLILKIKIKYNDK